MVRSIVEDMERERIVSGSHEALPSTGVDLWNRFDHEATGNVEFTMWQMVTMHSIMARLANLRAETCSDPCERALWTAYAAAYAGDEDCAREALRAAGV
jgi:hypothetical protein